MKERTSFRKSHFAKATHKSGYPDLDNMGIQMAGDLTQSESSLKVSEEKYRKLFEETADAIIVINKKGEFIEVNHAADLLFGIYTAKYSSLNFFDFVDSNSDDPEEIKEKIISKDKNDLILKIKNQKFETHFSCLVCVSPLSNSGKYMLILKDITDQIEMENLLLRTIIDTQEKERKRFARDIHDSLGQQLSAIKFYLSSLGSNVSLDKKNQNIIEKAEGGLKEVLASIREICYNLMPKTIENHGLLAAVKELCGTFSIKDKIEFQLNSKENFPKLKPDQEIAIFRIIQEFMNNSVKYAQPKKIIIEFSFSDKEIFMNISDDGNGFDLKKNMTGMGLKNVRSRAKSYNGNLKIYSSLNQGTTYKLIMPIFK